MKFGHGGNHQCNKEHVCGKKCRFNPMNGCPERCTKKARHVGDHQCSELKHSCSELCSLDNCQGKCIIECELKHKVHKCTKEQCIKTCSIRNCSNKCSARDHFHGTELSLQYRKEQKTSKEYPFILPDGTRKDTIEHFCENEHPCPHECLEDGFCNVWTEKQKDITKATFKSSRGTFDYEVIFADICRKLNCRFKLKPLQTSHPERHTCTSSTHSCTTKCPTCEKICDKLMHHDGLHHTRHGNMRKFYFIANEDIFEVGSHKYKVGEEAIAEMCHVFCSSLGRGHAHVIECDNPRACSYNPKVDGPRHQTKVYKPNPQIAKDEITHTEYWRHIGFKDPCQSADVKEFHKCPAFCPSETHEKYGMEESEKVYCIRPLWHDQVVKRRGPSDQGFVSADGHHFLCNHPVGTYHFVLCLDDSGSMHSKPWEDLKNAVETFVEQRKLVSTSDTLSIVIYNISARVVACNQPLSSFTVRCLTYQGGQTSFRAALSTADSLIGQNLRQNEIPVLIFMSDGNASDGEDEMINISKKYNFKYGLVVYTLGFGQVVFDKLQQLAWLGNGEHINVVDGIDLKNSFVEISAKHPPTIGVSIKT